jgi:hypothetical protein
MTEISHRGAARDTLGLFDEEWVLAHQFNDHVDVLHVFCPGGTKD